MGCHRLASYVGDEEWPVHTTGLRCTLCWALTGSWFFEQQDGRHSRALLRRMGRPTPFLPLIGWTTVIRSQVHHMLPAGKAQAEMSCPRRRVATKGWQPSLLEGSVVSHVKASAGDRDGTKRATRLPYRVAPDLTVMTFHIFDLPSQSARCPPPGPPFYGETRWYDVWTVRT